MKNELRLALALLAVAAGCRTVPVASFDAGARGELAEAVVAGWTPTSRLAAMKAIARFGPPDAIASDGLGWSRRAPWKRIVIRNADEDYVEREGTAAGLRQTVAYRMPASRRAEVADFGRGVRVSEEGDELSARSTDEAYNFLALNLADEVARGVKTPDEARRFYDRTVKLEAAGKSSLYLRELLFQPAE